MRTLQQRLRSGTPNRTDGGLQDEAQPAEQGLRLGGGHVVGGLAARQIGKDVCHPLRGGGEEHGVARRRDAQVARHAKLHLLRRAQLAFLRLEAQPHGSVQQVERPLS